MGTITMHDETSAGAQVATGLFLSSLMDGSVTDFTDDEAFALTGAAASVPEVAGKAFGLEPGVADQMGADRVQEAMLSEYYAAGFLDDFANAEVEAVEVASSMKEAREAAAFAYAGMTEEDVARAREDAANGDMSAMIAAKERFYLG